MKHSNQTTDELQGTVTDSSLTRREVMSSALTAGVGVTVGASLAPVSAQGSSAVAGAEQALESGAAAPLTLTINGKAHQLQLEPRVTLLDALRERVGLTGTKKGCDHGQCGACTVLVNGERINSCLTLAIMHTGSEITTIEGLAQGEQLHPVQAAFIEHDAFQCGYCTPGQICSAVGLMNEGHATTEDEIREAMAGNICRCGAYPHIVAAVRTALARA